MSNLAITPQWHDAINQVEKTESILGGPGGNANLATKQLAENILWLRKQFEDKTEQAFKVGDIYTTTLNHKDAAAVKTHHGYGTWERFAQGRALVGFSTNSNDLAEYKNIGTEFGENTHTLTVDEMPRHKHAYIAAHESASPERYPDAIGHISVNGQGAEYMKHEASEADGSVMNLDSGNSMFSSGNSDPHNNIQPSVVVGFWLRIA